MNWKEVNVKTYKKLYKSKSDFERMSILSNIPEKDLINGSLVVIESLRKRYADILFNKIPSEPTKTIKVGKNFYFIKYLSKYEFSKDKMTAGQFADLQVFTSSDKSIELYKKFKQTNDEEILKQIGVLTNDKITENLNKIVFILIKPENILYSDWLKEMPKMESEIDKCSIVDVYGLINFFLLTPNFYERILRESLRVQKSCLRKEILEKQRVQRGFQYLLNYPITMFYLLRISLMKI